VVDLVGFLVRGIAVLVGAANAFWLVTNGDRDMLAALSRSEILLILLAAALAGLVASALLLGRIRTVPEGRLFLRYAIAVLAVCFGGALLGALLPFVGLLSERPLPFIALLIDPFAPTADQLASIPGASLLGAIVGMVLGIIEGLFLAFFVVGINIADRREAN